ncbi:hypothetical protein JCM11641_001203 [Rhodosporidiobolus odoratus]
MLRPSTPRTHARTHARRTSLLPHLTRELHHHLLTLYELLPTESSIYLITELCPGRRIEGGEASSASSTATTGFADSPVASRIGGGGAGMFASRYAGIEAGPAAVGGGRREKIRPATLIEEEEEDEEE